MHWANFLHLYQPYYQLPEVLERIVGQSYRPIIEGLYRRPETRITINVNAVLLELFDQHGYGDLIEKLSAMGARGQIEFLASAKYHTLLPFLPHDEVVRQVTINAEVNRKYLGEAYAPRGIFLPEMAYAPSLNPIMEELGLEYLLLDEIAYDGHMGHVDYTKLYDIAGTKLKAFYRQRRVSNAIMHGAVRTAAELKHAADDDLGEGKYLVTGMDGEVFGHHHPGHEKLLFEMLEDPELGMGQVADLLTAIKPVAESSPQACSWADSSRDLSTKAAFFSWRDPDNGLQKLEWKLYDLTLTEFAKLSPEDPAYPELRRQLDPALASDIFFWSSARPWWSIEQIEDGANGLRAVVAGSPASTPEAKQAVQQLYHDIMDMAFTWRREGRLAAIHQERAEILRVPFKERADGATWQAFLHLMQREEERAAGKRDYEAAALWRDAIFKLEHKRDIYDGYHVVDMLRARIPNEDIEEALAGYKEAYEDIRGGQPEQRSN